MPKLDPISAKDMTAEVRAYTDSELHEYIRQYESTLADLRASGLQGRDPRDYATLVVEMTAMLGAMQEEKRLRTPERPLTQPGPRATLTRTGGRAVGDAGGFTDVGEIMQVLYRKMKGEGFDARLEPMSIRAAQVGESVPSEGGFAIPTLFVERALGEELEDTVLLQLCDRQIMTVVEMTVPGFEDTNHSTSAPFGISWSCIAEGASWGTLQGTSFRAIHLVAKKAGSLFCVRNEWLADSSTGIRRRLENIWRASLRWFVEDRLWSGTGAGEPLGALNGSGALEVPKETGQHADTIVTENVLKMWARLRDTSKNRAVWAYHATCFPQLATLSQSVGTGGAPVSLLQPMSIAGAPSTGILGRPLYTSEHLPKLGDAGDLVLLDPSLYLLGDRQMITLDVSPHGCTTDL